jgi:hypothetical protein
MGHKLLKSHTLTQKYNIYELKISLSYTAEATKVFQLQWFHAVAQYEKTII